MTATWLACGLLTHFGTDTDWIELNWIRLDWIALLVGTLSSLKSGEIRYMTVR